MSTTEDHKENSDMSASKQVYEIGYLVLPSIPEDKLQEVVNSIKEIIKKEGGEELDSENPFKQDLAYTMSKTVGASRYVVNDAYVGWMKFEAEPSVTEAIKAGLEKIDSILRFLLIKTTKETTFTFAEAKARLEKDLAEEEAETDSEEVKDEVVKEGGEASISEDSDK